MELGECSTKKVKFNKEINLAHKPIQTRLEIDIIEVKSKRITNQNLDDD